jgi:hypothetical protein
LQQQQQAGWPLGPPPSPQPTPGAGADGHDMLWGPSVAEVLAAVQERPQDFCFDWRLGPAEEEERAVMQALLVLNPQLASHPELAAAAAAAPAEAPGTPQQVRCARGS